MIIIFLPWNSWAFFLYLLFRSCFPLLHTKIYLTVSQRTMIGDSASLTFANYLSVEYSSPRIILPFLLVMTTNYWHLFVEGGLIPASMTLLLLSEASFFDFSSNLFSCFVSLRSQNWLNFPCCWACVSPLLPSKVPLLLIFIEFRRCNLRWWLQSSSDLHDFLL